MTDIAFIHSRDQAQTIAVLAENLSQLGYSVAYEYPANADEATIVQLQTERIESSAVIAVCLSQSYLRKLQQKDAVVLSGYAAWKDKKNVFVIILDSLCLTGLTSIVDLGKHTVSLLGADCGHCDKCDGHDCHEHSAQFLKLAWQLERFRGDLQVQQLNDKIDQLATIMIEKDNELRADYTALIAEVKKEFEEKLSKLEGDSARIDELFNRVVFRDQAYGVQSSRGGFLSDQGGWKGQPNSPDKWEVMYFRKCDF